MSKINWDEVLKDIVEKVRKLAETLNWDEVLEDIEEEISGKSGVRELVRYVRLKENFSLSELAEEIGISEENLRAYEDGEEVDSKVFLRIALWFFRKEEGSVGDGDLRDEIQLAILLCRLALYGTDEQLERLVDFAASLDENQEDSSEEQ